jgi:diguanylate cyclase (GGDEF)-like protein
MIDVMKTLSNLKLPQSKLFCGLAGFALVGIIGIIDYLTGYEIGFSLFYLLPIFFVTWQTGKPLGIIISIASALVWFLADMLAGSVYSVPVIAFWNMLIRFSFFIIVVLLLAALRKALEHERELSRVDNMTGAVNYRFFSVLLEMEIERTRRYKTSFTLAYIDIDNFKTINDQYGHSIGDNVLRNVVIYLINNLRKTDIVARLGGDEFAILLPETDQVSASTLLTRIQQGLSQEMYQSNWPVTFSIGVLTCLDTTPSVDEVIKRADEVMYSVKKNGKNAITFATCSG